MEKKYDIKKRLEKPIKAATLQKIISHQKRIAFHVKTEVEADKITERSSEFMDFVKSLLPSDKVETFKTLLKNPIKTTEITAEIFDKLARVFDSGNPAHTFQFKKSESYEDWQFYRREVLKSPDVWSTTGFEYFKNNINSLVVIDLPSAEDVANIDDNKPRPYFYFVTPDRIVDYETDPRTGEMTHVAFKRDGDELVVIDDVNYSVYEYKNGKLGDLISESDPHKLGFCPARWFWETPLDVTVPDIKASPVSKILGSLDWFLFFSVSKKHLDLFGAYPIYSGYEQDCTYTDSTGAYCSSGHIITDKGAHTNEKCPVCSTKRIAGPGSFVEVPIPDADGVDLRNPVTALFVDRNSLDYNVEEESRLKAALVNTVVGIEAGEMNTEAYNVEQVNANFESQRNVLSRVKKGFESIMTFVEAAICKLRYDDFVSCDINLGTEFYLFSATQLRERYVTAKQSGASEAELAALQTQILETEFRHNPTMLERMSILSELEPYTNLTRDEIVEYNKLGLIDRENLILKLNFNTFVKRFELENGLITEFGINLESTKRVEAIKTTLKQYVNEQLTRINAG